MNPSQRVVKGTAADFMTSPVHCLADSLDVREAMGQFEELGISGAPVVDAEGRLVGVLSQTDVVHYYLGRDDELGGDSDWYHRAHLGEGHLPRGFTIMDTNVPRVRDIMSPVIVTAQATTAAPDLARTMVDRRVHRIVITGDGGDVVGIVSALDLLQALS